MHIHLSWTGKQNSRFMFNVFSLAESLRIPTPEIGNNLIGDYFMHGMMDMFALIGAHANGLTKI